jgi:hypothetical protein
LNCFAAFKKPILLSRTAVIALVMLSTSHRFLMFSKSLFGLDLGILQQKHNNFLSTAMISNSKTIERAPSFWDSYRSLPNTQQKKRKRAFTSLFHSPYSNTQRIFIAKTHLIWWNINYIPCKVRKFQFWQTPIYCTRHTRQPPYFSTNSGMAASRTNVTIPFPAYSILPPSCLSNTYNFGPNGKTRESLNTCSYIFK